MKTMAYVKNGDTKMRGLDKTNWFHYLCSKFLLTPLTQFQNFLL